MRIPNHIGVIPDGNRRWSVDNGLSKDQGYTFGLDPGLALYKICKSMGVKEITYYGFTTDNTKRPALQREAFAKACVDAVKLLSTQDADLLVVGNSDSPMFPKELIPFTTRKTFGKGGIKLNFLVNYGWEWDLSNLDQNKSIKRGNIINCIKTNDISRVDLIIRWGGRRRLSGFLPLQSIYSDFYVIDDFWPDFKPDHLLTALNWYNDQDLTLGG